MHYKRNIIIKGLRKPLFCLYTNSTEKFYQLYPKGFLLLWNKEQKITTSNNCSVLVFSVTFCSYF